MNKLTIAFVGLGVIGGSIAKAIRIAHPKATILAYDIDETTLSSACREGVVSKAYSQIDSEFGQSDFIFLCGPISENIKNLTSLKRYLSSSCLITDVGSVKATIHKAITELSLDASFIGGHPMAGSEKTGYENSTTRLLENAYYILTPTRAVSSLQIEAYTSLVTSIGAIPLILTPEKHDYVTAAISHLPHIIASSLVNLVKESDSQEGIMKMIAAGGFKDITRIASSSPSMWQHISLNNQENISQLLADYIASLQQLEATLKTQQKEKLYDFFVTARDYRDSFEELSNGPIQKAFGFYMDIPDETGVIATIVTILAKEDINIKNIGIVNNREFEEGVLRIEFYEDTSSIKSMSLLMKKGYIIYKR